MRELGEPERGSAHAAHVWTRRHRCGCARVVGARGWLRLTSNLVGVQTARVRPDAQSGDWRRELVRPYGAIRGGADRLVAALAVELDRVSKRYAIGERRGVFAAPWRKRHSILAVRE